VPAAHYKPPNRKCAGQTVLSDSDFSAGALPIGISRISDKCLGGQQKLSALSRCHVPARLTSAPSVLAAGLAVILPPECPEFSCNSTRTRSWPVSSFLTAPEIATAAFIRIWRLVDPCEFGADFVDGRVRTRHELTVRFVPYIPSALEFIGCRLHHGFCSHIATDHMGLLFWRERYTSE
jgi:hypothetical protein